ncbi:MAG TPA: hypothetical protein VMT22_07105 [Terriglobales bacterium]|nr:hypothetical protein [Terriglobales bacterium]
MTNPTIIRPPPTIAITARVPHSFAAALLLDYHLSKEASESMEKSHGPLGAAQRRAMVGGAVGRSAFGQHAGMGGGRKTASWRRC